MCRYGTYIALGKGLFLFLASWGMVGASFPFFVCARQGAPTRRCKSSTDPTGGTVSLTARVSTVRWNLKEAAGKALA